MILAASTSQQRTEEDAVVYYEKPRRGLGARLI